MYKKLNKSQKIEGSVYISPWYCINSNINFFMNREESLLDGNIFARISLKGYPFSVQAQGDCRAYSEPRYYYGPVNIHKLRVKIYSQQCQQHMHSVKQAKPIYVLLLIRNTLNITYY